MKKGRLGTRLEVLATPDSASLLEDLMLTHTPTIGVRRTAVSRKALNRDLIFVDVLGHCVGVKRVQLPSGQFRDKPEAADVSTAAGATGRTVREVTEMALDAARRGTSGV
jgi:uncharacterized protein (DUF111 family)